MQLNQREQFLCRQLGRDFQWSKILDSRREAEIFLNIRRSISIENSLNITFM